MSYRRYLSISTVQLFCGKPNYSQCLSRISTGTTIHTEFKRSIGSCSPKPMLFKTDHNMNVASFKYDAYTFLRIPGLYSSHRQTNVYFAVRFFGVSKSSTEDNVTKETPPEKLTLLQKFKAMYRDYWYVLVPVHLLTSAVWFGSFYYMARIGVDIAALAEMAHFSDEVIEKIRKSGNSLAGHLALSYLLYKVFTPLRYTVTLGGTTISINYLRRWGWIKPMPKREELKKMFDDKKVELRRKRDSFKERHELMKRSVNKMKLTSKKRIKKTSDMVDRMLQRRRNNRKE